MLCLVIASDGTAPNLTAASQNLYELIREQALVAYPDEAIRLAISRAVAIETPRGWKISKEKISHRIDVVVALALAAYAGRCSPPNRARCGPRLCFWLVMPRHRGRSGRQ
jgi:phage terminase large subunit-like protein